jgi:hypothetical protein
MEWTGERNEIFKGLDALYIPYNEGWDCHGRAMWRVCKVKNFDRIRRIGSDAVMYYGTIYDGHQICYTEEDAWDYINNWRTFRKPIFPLEKIPKCFGKKLFV